MSKEDPEDPFDKAINEALANSAFANSAAANSAAANSASATLSDLLIRSPNDSPNELHRLRSLTSGLIAAGCIPSSTLVCTLPSPMPASPANSGHKLGSSSISPCNMGMFADQFLAKDPSSPAPSAPKRIRLFREGSEKATKASEEASHSAALPSYNAPFIPCVRTGSNDSNASNASNASYASYFSMRGFLHGKSEILPAAASFTGEGGGSHPIHGAKEEAPAGK